MRIGLQVPHYRPSTPETRREWLKETAQTIEAGGFYSMWVMDHFFQLGGTLGDPETEMMEGYTTLGYLAGVTEKLKLGLLVGGVIYRYPAIVVKLVSTLDVLSGGRMYFGIGAAWYEHESLSLGLPFPEKKVRFELLEEQLQIAHKMFAGDDTPYEGKHTQMPRPHNNPQPLQKTAPADPDRGDGADQDAQVCSQIRRRVQFLWAGRGRTNPQEPGHFEEALRGCRPAIR